MSLFWTSSPFRTAWKPATLHRPQHTHAPKYNTTSTNFDIEQLTANCVTHRCFYWCWWYVPLYMVCTFSTISSEFSPSSSSSSCFWQYFCFYLLPAVRRCWMCRSLLWLCECSRVASPKLTSIPKHEMSMRSWVAFTTVYATLSTTRTIHARHRRCLSHIYRHIRTATTTISVAIAYYIV